MTSCDYTERYYIYNQQRRVCVVVMETAHLPPPCATCYGLTGVACVGHVMTSKASPRQPSKLHLSRVFSRSEI